MLTKQTTADWKKEKFKTHNLRCSFNSIPARQGDVVGLTTNYQKQCESTTIQELYWIDYQHALSLSFDNCFGMQTNMPVQLCSNGLRSGGCESHCIWFSFFSYTNHSVSSHALWIAVPFSFKRTSGSLICQPPVGIYMLQSTKMMWKGMIIGHWAHNSPALQWNVTSTFNLGGSAWEPYFAQQYLSGSFPCLNIPATFGHVWKALTVMLPGTRYDNQYNQLRADVCPISLSNSWRVSQLPN